MKGKRRKPAKDPRKDCPHDSKSWAEITMPDGTVIKVRICDDCGTRV